MSETSVKNLMKKDIIVISPDTTLKDAAEKMATIKCGVLPVGTLDKLEGVITDRDIVIRAVAKGRDTSREVVRDYMTPEVHSCKEDDTTSHAADRMRETGVSRIVVEDKEGKPIGILTFGSIIRKSGSMQELTTVIECAVGRKAA